MTLNIDRPTQSSNYWMIALKLFMLVLGLYLSALVLGKVFTWVFAIAFFLVRFIVFVAVSFIVLHFFLKLLFKIDLIESVFGKRYFRR